MTKEEKRICDLYANSNDYSLFHVYGRVSQAKLIAWYNIVEEMRQNEGYYLKVLSHNTFQFTCAYRYYDHNDQKSYLVYHTSTKRQKIDISNMYNELGYYFG